MVNRLAAVAAFAVLAGCGDAAGVADAGRTPDGGTDANDGSVDTSVLDADWDAAEFDAGEDAGGDEDAGAGGIVFETDFSDDTGWVATDLNGLWQRTGAPTGWSGYRGSSGGGSDLRVLSGEGVAGGNALRMTWSPALAQPNLNLGKHLTGNIDAGYDELYIRYHVRLPNAFKVGSDGTFAPYWKWGRLWQNTDPTVTRSWTENRVDAFYIVWNFSGGTEWGIDIGVGWGANSGVNLDMGSAGGERARLDYFVSGAVHSTQDGYFTAVGGGAWDVNTTDRPGELVHNTAQTWHTIEYHFKLASSDVSEDGVFEVWFDGLLQGPYTSIESRDGAPPFTGIPTSRHGSGLNFFSFFDNMAGWNDDWDQAGIEGFIDVNDVVVSTRPIGHGYVVRP